MWSWLRKSRETRRCVSTTPTVISYVRKIHIHYQTSTNYSITQLTTCFYPSNTHPTIIRRNVIHLPSRVIVVLKEKHMTGRIQCTLCPSFGGSRDSITWTRIYAQNQQISEKIIKKNKKVGCCIMLKNLVCRKMTIENISMLRHAKKVWLARKWLLKIVRMLAYVKTDFI